LILGPVWCVSLVAGWSQPALFIQENSMRSLAVFLAIAFPGGVMAADIEP
jgi:hypothetical protein